MLKLSNTKLKGKRILAWLLAAALVAGTPGQAAYASEGDSDVPEAAEDMPEVLAHFDFENEAEICSPDSGSEATEAKGFIDNEDESTRAVAVITGEKASVNTEGAVGTGSLKLDGNTYLTVRDAEGNNILTEVKNGERVVREEVTISYYSKGASSWAWFAARHVQDGDTYKPNNAYQSEHCIGLLDNGTGGEADRWNNSGSRPDGTKIEFSGTKADEWKMVTVSMTETGYVLYINGKKVGSSDDFNVAGYTVPKLSEILNVNSPLWIGVGSWASYEYFKGSIDEFTVYGGALTEEQVIAEYLNNKSDDGIKAYFKDYVDGELGAQVVKADSKLIAEKLIAISDLTLPTSYDGATITWTSSNEGVITNSGELKVYDGSDATLTAAVSYQIGGRSVTDSLSYSIKAYNEVEDNGFLELKAFVPRGSQAGQAHPFIACQGTQGNNKNGNEQRAAYKDGITANTNNLPGGTRIGIVQFTISNKLTPDMIDNAIMTAHVESGNGELKGGWTKAAAFETDNPDTFSDEQKANDLVSDVPAKNKDYSYDATMYSNERIYEAKVTKLDDSGKEEDVTDKTITFDVTKALKNAVANRDKTLVLRLQTVSGGYSLTEKGVDGQPSLKISFSEKANVTVKYVNGENELKPSKTITEKKKVGDSYTYEVQDDEEVITTADGVYVRDITSAENELTVARVNRNSSQNIIKVAYKPQEIKSIAVPEDDIYIIAGNKPIFPAQLTAQTDAGKELTVDVDWPDAIMVGETETALEDLKAGTYDIIGKAGTNEVKVKLQVLECDEVVGDAGAGANGTKYPLKKAYKGKIVAEFDVVVTNTAANGDMVVTYTDKDGNWMGDSGPRIDFGTAGGNSTPYFRAQKGSGTNGEGGGNYPASGTYTDGSGYVKTENGKTYRVRMEIDDATKQGLYRTYITEENGTVTKLFEDTGKETDGLIFRGWTGDGIMNFWTARNGFNVTNHKISWTSGWSKYTVNTFVDGKKVDTVTSDKEIVGTDHSSYEPEAIYKSEDGKKAFLNKNKEGSGWKNGESAAGDKKTIEYNAYYETSEIASQDETIELTTRVGYAPELPETVKAKYKNNIQQEEEVEWNEITPSKYAQDGEYKATGKFKGTEVPVEATVTVVTLKSVTIADYSFDEAEDDTTAVWKDSVNAEKAARNASAKDDVTIEKGLAGTAIKLRGTGTKGAVQLPDDLLQVKGETQNTFTISTFVKRKSQGNSFALTLHATQVAISDPEPVGYIGFINKGNNNTKQFGVEYRAKSHTETLQNANKVSQTNVDEWVHVAFVTQGRQAWLYLNGEEVAYLADTKMNASDLVAQNNWIGRAPWGDGDYQGTFDEFTVYNEALTPAEIKDICDETLYKLQVEKTKAVLQNMIKEGNFSYADDSGKINKDEVDKNISLPTTLDDEEAGIGTIITWKSSDDGYVDDEGNVYQPSKDEGNKEVTLTATIKAGEIEETVDFVITVKEGDGLNFTSLKNAITRAQAQYNAAQAKNIYSEASMKELEGKIVAANKIAEYGAEGATPPTDMSYADINAARLDLETALKALKLKGFDELNVKEILKAYYPLTENADDASGNNKNGTATGVTFSEAEGAHFTESKTALTSCIKLPNTLDVTDEMTFSFWAKDERGTKSNAFGIGSGNSFSNSGKVAKFFYVSTHDGGKLLASVNTKYWTEATNVSTEAAAKGAWHHITGVLSGKTLTLYVNGVEIGNKETKATLTEIWNHDPGTRNIYIGNCSYGIRTSNADSDYQGNIRDFRIYGVSLEASQVAEVYRHMEKEYKEKLSAAKADIVTAIVGEDAEAGEDGTYSYSVPRTVTSLTLPKSGQNWESIKWQSNSTAINVATGAITLAETAKTVTLTATITVGNQTEDIIIKCILPKEEADKTALQTAINTAKALTKADYTGESWDAMWAKLEAANGVNDDGDATPTQVNNAKEALEEAISNLVPIEKEALNTAIKNAEQFIKDETGSKSEYPDERWRELESALADAKNVYADSAATAERISTATETLTEAKNAMKKTSVIEQETAKEELGTSLTTAKTDVQELGITEDNAAELASAKVWSDYVAALEAAQALDETASKDALETAKENLDNALAELKETVQTKQDLNTAITEASELTEEDFEDETAWETFQSALTEATTAVENSDATSSSLKAALSTLNDALQAKKPTDEVTLSLDPTKLSLKVGATATIKANVTPEDTKVEWSSDKKNIATVDKNGKVKAVAKGTATITAKAGDITATCKVTVTTVPVKNVKITESLAGSTKPAVAKGKKITLKATITPSNATNKKVKWSIDKKFAKYASITSKGVLSAKKAGAGKTVTVAATAQDGSKKKATIKVKIMKDAVTKITLKAGKKTVKAGKKITVKATVKSNKASKTLAWSIDKKSAKYASINSKGVLSTKKTGKGKTVTVTATATDGTKKKATIKIKLTK